MDINEKINTVLDDYADLKTRIFLGCKTVLRDEGVALGTRESGWKQLRLDSDSIRGTGPFIVREYSIDGEYPIRLHRVNRDKVLEVLR